MTAQQLISRFRANVRLFPALAILALVTSLTICIVVVTVIGFVSHSIWLGFATAVMIIVIDAGTSFSLALIIARNPEALANMQRCADMAVTFFRAKPTIGSATEDGDPDYDPNEDEEDEEPEMEPEQETQ